MVDEKGRLFGKINLLDLVIVLVVLAVVGLFGYKAMGKTRGGPVTTAEQPMEVTFLFPAVRKASVDQLKPGVKLYDSKSSTKPLLGPIVDVTTQPSIITVMSGDGRMISEVESKDKVDLYVTVRGTGSANESGVNMSGLDVKVGRLYDMISARWAGSGTAWIINDTPPKREGQ